MAITLSEEGFGRYRLTELVDIEEFARMAGVQPRTIHSYRYHPTTNYWVPKPVAHVGSTPVWTKRQVLDWLEARPGQGSRVDLYPI